MFPEDTIFDFALIDFASDLASRSVSENKPLTCDRWLARSALQKACRRGEVQMAQRALATLFIHDRDNIWRHMVVIAIEDVGVADFNLIVRIVAAHRDRKWRAQMGGDWVIASNLVRELATSAHCQAACDLLLNSLNLVQLADSRHQMLMADSESLLTAIGDPKFSFATKAVAVIALAGRSGQAAAAFDVMATSGYASHVVTTCRVAFKICRNPMALLLPLVWEVWAASEHQGFRDDVIPVSALVGEVPDYAIDQFTRVGGQVARAYLTASPRMRTLFDRAHIARTGQPRVLGDLIFVGEGSALSKRIIWNEAVRLAQPIRCLPGIVALSSHAQNALEILAQERELLTSLRQRSLSAGQGV